jgi:hypothetical protein
MVTKQEIRAKLATSDAMVIQSLCRLANRQEEIEKLRKASIFVNDRGFRKQHGCLVSFAERVWKGEILTQEEIEFLRYRMRIYAGQLAQMATARQLSLF